MGNSRDNRTFYTSAAVSMLLLLVGLALVLVALNEHRPLSLSTSTLQSKIDSTNVCIVGDDDFSCSYNGVCKIREATSKSYCNCDPGWTGIYCEALDLLPVINGSGLQDLLTMEDTSTWGGSVVYNPQDKLYHMWYSEITHHCGIHRWVSNSVVNHAVSLGPKTMDVVPWRFQPVKSFSSASTKDDDDDDNTQHQPLFPIFTHEPIVVQDPISHEFVLFVSHYPNGSATDTGQICHCQDGNTASTTDKDCDGEEGLGKNQTMYSYFTTSSSPYGPWSELQSMESVTPVGQRHVDLNFSPLLLKSYPHDNRNKNNNSTVFSSLSSSSLLAWTRWDIWIADDWKNLSTYKVDGQAPNFSSPNGHWEGEDPSMWQDVKGRFHILSHNGDRGGNDCGRHLFSKTGRAGTWVTSPIQPMGGCAYPRENVTFDDGSLRTFYRRERPHLIFGPDGTTPVALSTAVIDDPTGPESSSTNFIPPQRDASYTMIQAINTIMEPATIRIETT